MMENPMEMVMTGFLQPEKDTQSGFIVFRYSGFVEERAIEKLETFKSVNCRSSGSQDTDIYGPPRCFILITPKLSERKI
jgi:hypothetical protein